MRTIGSAFSTIDQSGSYVLSGPIFAGTGGDGITITASSVTIDLNGQEILCPGGLRGVGIRRQHDSTAIQQRCEIELKSTHSSLLCARDVPVGPPRIDADPRVRFATCGPIPDAFFRSEATMTLRSIVATIAIVT